MQSATISTSCIGSKTHCGPLVAVVLVAIPMPGRITAMVTLTTDQMAEVVGQPTPVELVEDDVPAPAEPTIGRTALATATMVPPAVVEHR